MYLLKLTVLMYEILWVELKILYKNETIRCSNCASEKYGVPKVRSFSQGYNFAMKGRGAVLGEFCENSILRSDIREEIAIKMKLKFT